MQAGTRSDPLEPSWVLKPGRLCGSGTNCLIFTYYLNVISSYGLSVLETEDFHLLTKTVFELFQSVSSKVERMKLKVA